MSPVDEVVLLLESIVKAIVDRPEDVKVTPLNGERSLLLELSVHPSDVGKVIGKKGVHAESIRQILHAAGGKIKRRIDLDIDEGVR